MMSTMRAREPRRMTEEEIPFRAALLTVRAGDSFVVRVGAQDRQSGVAEIIVRCRARDHHDLATHGRWAAPDGKPGIPFMYSLVARKPV